jgi:hypothetical protein
MKTHLAAITVGLTLLMEVNPANAIELYNGLSIPSQTPEQQGWLYQSRPPAPAPAVTATSKGTIVDTTGNINKDVGYFRQSPAPLNRKTGYTIRFSMQVNSQSSQSNDSAGFSVIVSSALLAGETQPYGIELGFWQSSIWAQNANFTPGEKVSYNTSAAVRNYRLYVKGKNYKLFADGSSTPILKGQLRQYTGGAPFPEAPNPYSTPNMIFLGDKTTSAGAKVTLVRVRVD